MSKLELDGWVDAGKDLVKLPRAYSGYTDSQTQVILARRHKLSAVGY